MVRSLSVTYCPNKYPLTRTRPPRTNAPQELITSSVSLIWHPSGEGQTPSRRLPSPVRVDAWIEQGARLKKTLVQPKLMWRPIAALTDCCAPPQADLILLPPPLPRSSVHRSAQHRAHILPPPNCRSGRSPPGEAPQEPRTAVSQRGGGSGGRGEEEGIVPIRGP